MQGSLAHYEVLIYADETVVFVPSKDDTFRNSNIIGHEANM